jgi:hypothetical protein
MKAAVIALALVAVLALAQQKPRKAADVRVLETTARREESRITLDGKVRAIGEKPLRGLVIFFDFRSPEREVITAQKTTVAEDTLENGREGSYHVEMADAARAVTYTVRAFDIHEKELRVENMGPFPIE